MRTAILKNTVVLCLFGAFAFPHRLAMAHLMRLIPLEQRVEQVDLIVVGTIQETVAEPMILAVGQEYRIDTGTLNVTCVLKGKAPPGGVRVAFYTAIGESRIVCPAPEHYCVGDTGIWLLIKDESKPYYWASHIDDHRPIGDLPLVKAALAFADAKAKSGLLPQSATTPPLFPNKKFTVTASITNVGDDVLMVKKGDILSASVVAEDGLGSVETHSVVIEEGEVVSILPQATQSLAVIEVSVDKPGSYLFRVKLKPAESANARLKVWGDRIFSPLETIYVLDPERHAKATGIARTLLDLYDTDYSALDAKLDALCSQDDMTFVLQLARAMDIDELHFLASPMLEEAVAVMGQKTAPSLISALAATDDRFVIDDINFLLMQATNTFKVEVEFAEEGSLVTYELLRDGGRSVGSESLCSWGVPCKQRLLSRKDEVFYLRKRLTEFWREKLFPSPPIAPTQTAAPMAIPIASFLVLLGMIGIWLHYRRKSHVANVRRSTQP